MTTTTRCPSSLELEAYLLDPVRSPLAAHVDACARCGGEVAEMRRIGDEFRRAVFPATVDAVLERARPRRLPRWIFAAVPLGAAAAIALVVAQVARPPEGYVGLKGAALGLTVFVSDGASAHAAPDGEPVPARAAVRFQVRPARPCRLWLVSVDGAGQVSRLFPPGGDAPEVTSGETLPGGAMLDGRPGPERFFAVCSPTPLAYADVERAARAVASGGAGSVRSARSLAGLPRDAAQATTLLEKQP